VKASAVEPAHAQRFRSWVQSNPYEALSCQETNDPCERFFFPLYGSRRRRHLVAWPDLISVCGRGPNVSAPHTY
jgi:hypothetical protein